MLPLFFLGKVSDNKDPDSLNRIRVSKMGEEEFVTDWIPIMSPYTGDDVGMSLLPDIDNQVIVLSSDTNNSKMIALGSLWSNDVSPPVTEENSDADLNKDGENNLIFLKSRSGSLLIMDDTEAKEKVQILSSDKKSRLEFLNEEELISLMTENDLTLAAKVAVSIQAEEIDLSSEKEMNISGEECQVEAKKVADIKADKDISIKGSGIALN